jgi:glucose-1-phosphate adenylyltransferase
MKPEPRTLAMVLAGGQGKRLSPLTLDRAKPAVPFGANYRLVDFVLSNLVNGGYRRIAVLTQYKSHSLDRHISQTWQLSPMLGYYVATVPAQMRKGPHWFAGSADALFQNLNLVYDERPDYVLVFGADHIYRMDPRQMLDEHMASGAGVTVASLRVPRLEAEAFGVIKADSSGKILSFLEKPADPPGLPDSPDEAYASMGNYIFTTDALIAAMSDDANDPDSLHDVGGNIIPMLVSSGDAMVYDFVRNEVPGAEERDRGYWRDVGTLDSYYDAHMDLVSVSPSFNLYNKRWPIYSWHHPAAPPAKFVFDQDGRRGQALDSIVSEGTIVAGGTVRKSVLSANVQVHGGALVEGSVLLSGVVVGEGAVIRNAIVDKNVRVSPGAQLGTDPDLDAKRFAISENGIVVVSKNDRVY